MSETKRKQFQSKNEKAKAQQVEQVETAVSPTSTRQRAISNQTVRRIL